MFKYMRRNIGRLPTRNMPTGIGRHVQVLSKRLAAIRKTRQRDTLGGERALFGASGTARRREDRHHRKSISARFHPSQPYDDEPYDDELHS